VFAESWPGEAPPAWGMGEAHTDADAGGEGAAPAAGNGDGGQG